MLQPYSFAISCCLIRAVLWLVAHIFRCALALSPYCQRPQSKANMKSSFLGLKISSQMTPGKAFRHSLVQVNQDSLGRLQSLEKGKCHHFPDIFSVATGLKTNASTLFRARSCRRYRMVLLFGCFHSTLRGEVEIVKFLRLRKYFSSCTEEFAGPARLFFKENLDSRPTSYDEGT
jgi:hypothetical protein